MISIDEIEKSIIELEQKDTTYAVVERLAWLYIVRDNLRPVKPRSLTGSLEGSEFINVCANVPVEPLLNILDEHFSIIKAIYPKEYTAIIERIVKLKTEL